MSAEIETSCVEPGELGLDASVLARLVERIGPAAVLDLETTGLAGDGDSELLELGVVLLDPGRGRVTTAGALLRPERPLPRAIQRLTGLCDADVAGGHALEGVAPAFAALLEGRAILAHNAPFERHFLARFISRSLDRALYLDTQDLLSITHPDAPDLRLETFIRLLLGRDERHRALEDALDTARVLSQAGRGADAGEARYATARHVLETFVPGSPWLALLGKGSDAFAGPGAPVPAYVAIGPTDEPPVPFDEDAIAAALADEARGRRYLPGYRARGEQIEMARRFARTLAGGGLLLLEGGTGVGKSLAYLAAAIPYAMECRARDGGAPPVVLSTRTRLLQDQLLEKDIAAAARFLGHPELRALSIKGRANYACERRLMRVLDEGREPRIFPEDRMAYAALAACAATRPYGEIGTLPGALLRRFPPLRDLLRRSVAARAEQCSREQCAACSECPLGRRRAALGDAHLVVTNHDLLLRWPPDYPVFDRAVVDEAHELTGVADEVYASEVRPEELIDRLDEIFGRPGARPEAGRGGGALLPAPERHRLARDAAAWRRALQQDFVALGRSLASLASEFGEVQLPSRPGPRFDGPARIATAAADRLEEVAGQVTSLDAAGGGPDASAALDRAAGELRAAAASLRLAFEGSGEEAVSAFEGVLPPFDRWRLAVRAVSPAKAFHARFLDRVEAFAGVSASLFVSGDAFAALGELEIEERGHDRLERLTLPSPFPYDRHMRVVALEGGGDPVEETAAVIADLAQRLGGRTLGLFTSLRRMNSVAERLAEALRPDGLEVLAPRRSTDDPGALVQRFQRHGAAVLLGARSFWQGLDIPGEELQAVVIEKLPFEVPTELRRRREARIRASGQDAFERYTLGKMLLYLKQMIGRLIRTEDDRGVVVIVDGRTQQRYFQRLEEALPPGSRITRIPRDQLPEVLAEVGLSDSTPRG